MEENTTHYVRISDEAKFDYAFMFGLLVGDFGSDLPPLFQLDSRIKEELELFILLQKRLWYKGYFRATYIYEEVGKELMLFVKKREKEENKQYWEIVGICEAKDYDEDLEEYGQIRAWYESKIDNLPEDEPDWVELMYARKILDLLEDIRDYGGYDDYINARERVAEELSKQSSMDSRNRKVKPRRVKSYIEKRGVDSQTANAIIKQLDILLEEARQRYDNETF